MRKAAFFAYHKIRIHRGLWMKEQENLTGKGITAAVLDTGIFPHMDFDGRIVAFRDLVYGRETPYDDNGHGTHVCGILGGSGRASGGKYQGAAPGCRFVVVKILDRRGNGRKQDILAAIDWVCKERIRLNIRILNISVGTTEQEKTVDDLLVQAVERAWDDGITVVTAAGNLGPAPGSITVPGSSRKVITVGAGDLLEPRRGISGCGPTRDCVCKPDLVAPGKRLISCAPGRSRKEYVVKSGTSMAAPRVSGAVALALERVPDLTNVQAKMLLCESARDLGLPRNRQGHGMLQTDRFLSLL